MNSTMKKLFLSVCLLLVTLLSAVAENYPYRSDVLWVTVPNHADWIYKTGEKRPWKYNSINMVSPEIT